MEHTCIEHENTLVWSKWGGVEIPAARIAVRYAGARVGVVQNMDIDNMQLAETGPRLHQPWPGA
jgi:hypothetical protein